MPRPTEIPLARAASQFAAGRYAEAAGCYRAVLSIDPHDHRAYLGLADCAVGRGMRDDAIEELVGAAADFRERDDYDGAFALLARALAIDPDRLELHVDVAELESASGRLEMALGRLENLALAYESSGQYEEAAAIHDVIEAWQSPEAPEAPATLEPVIAHQIAGIVEPVPEPIPPASTYRAAAAPPPPPPSVPKVLIGTGTQPVILGPAAFDETPLPMARPSEHLLVQSAMPGTPKTVVSAVTESVLLRKTPPPPPPPRAVRSAAPKAVPGTPTPVSATSSDPTRRGPRRDSVAPRWRPSTVQGKELPEVARKKAPAVAAQPVKRTAIVQPAPSPKRGAVKLDKLPPLSGPSQVRKPSAGIPRVTPNKHTARLHPHLPESPPAAPEPVATVAKIVLDQRPVAAAPKANTVRPKTSTPVQPARPQPPKSSLAARLRRASAGSAAMSPRPGEGADLEEEPTRLWAPDSLLLQF